MYLTSIINQATTATSQALQGFKTEERTLPSTTEQQCFSVSQDLFQMHDPLQTCSTVYDKATSVNMTESETQDLPQLTVQPRFTVQFFNCHDKKKLLVT